MPDRPIFDVFDTSGDLRVRMGDISGRPWGGASFVLPEGTFGLWTDREGAWLRGNVTMFYANSRTATLSDSLTLTDGPGGTHRLVVVVNEVFPFGTITVAAGRIVTMEYFLHSLTAGITAPTGITDISIVLNQFRFLSSRAGAAESAFDFLSGPTTGTVTYASTKLRMTYHIAFTSPGGFGGGVTLSYSITRVASIRMFAHEVHADATFARVTQTIDLLTGISGENRGAQIGDSGTDQGGGTGTDNVTGGGDTPGGVIIV